jgi:hypothetical protein
MISDAMMRARMLSRAPVVLQQMRTMWRGFAKWRFRGEWPDSNDFENEPDLANPLRAFFASHKEGPGIWKWDHYFDIYHRHFNRFRGTAVRVLEIGIYSGGSLQMWREYFGPRCQIFGIDIEPACKIYESDSVRVFIGDQSDRNFWKRLKQEVPAIDIVVDDGSHIPEHQIITLEELLPVLQPGGVYLCEDIHGTLNTFASYVYGFAHNLNATAQVKDNLDDNERRITCLTTKLQSAVRSIHLYPYVTVVERNETPVSKLTAPKHGTQWQPFLK